MIVFFSYIFYFIAASASPLQRRWIAKTKNLENNGQIHFAFMTTLICSILSLFILFFQPFFILGNIFTIVILTLLCGVFGAGFYMSSYFAQRHVEAGVSSVISNIYTPITIILATFFLNEKLTLVQILGTLLLLAGMVIVSKKHRIGRFSFDKYFLLMLSSGVMLAVVLVSERAMVNMSGFAAGTMLSWWSTCLFLGLATLITKNKNVYSTKDIAITGILRFFQNLSWVMLVFVVGNLSLVSSITTFKVVLIFFLGATFLNEKEDLPRKIIGSIIALAGLLLMK
jgi:drug/metabolite transporter (DMT)-like permease